MDEEDFRIQELNRALADGFEVADIASDLQRRSRSKSTWRDQLFTAEQLQRRQYPEVKYIVPGLIPEGVSLLAGKPKIGKSWLGLDMAVAVATGGSCLGLPSTSHGAVLYCAMEDNERRLKSRLTKVMAANAPWPKSLALCTHWARFNKGGVEDIRQWCESVENPRLVILDTLAHVKPQSTSEGYAQDYQALTDIHRFANDRGIAVVILHHQRKGEAEDPLDTVSGTLGIVGCADTTLILTSTKQGKSLYLRGRDIEETEHAVEFDAFACRWRILGDLKEVRMSDTRRRICDALRSLGKAAGPKDIGACSGLDETTVKVRLGDMVEAGEVLKVGRGLYLHPSLQTSLPS